MKHQVRSVRHTKREIRCKNPGNIFNKLRVYREQTLNGGSPAEAEPLRHFFHSDVSFVTRKLVKLEFQSECMHKPQKFLAQLLQHYCSYIRIPKKYILFTASVKDV